MRRVCMLLRRSMMFVLPWSLLVASDLVADTPSGTKPTVPVDFPPGTYAKLGTPVPFGGGCRATQMTSAGALLAVCPDDFGNELATGLGDAFQCVHEKHDIENINGTLRCVISKQQIGGAHPYTADIISIQIDNKTQVFRIDQPRVDVPSDEIKQISFQPGDTLLFSAGGCVQTGGSQRVWKRYAPPSKNSIGLYFSGTAIYTEYSGTVEIKGVTDQGAGPDFNGHLPFAPLVNHVLTVPNLGEKIGELTLGYIDLGDYGTNGYWNYESLNRDQCQSSPAWIELQVTHHKVVPPGKPYAPKWSHYSRPFDLVWDTKNETYDHLPLNPYWAFQIEHPEKLPDFAKTCGAAFAGPSLLSLEAFDSKLSQICTSQKTILDLADPQSDWAGGPIPAQFFGYCSTSTTLMSGHLTWRSIVTYTGNISWQGWSGDPDFWNLGLADGDYNLLLGPTNNAGLTDQNNFSNDEVGMGLEFKDTESLLYARGPWWRQLETAAQNGTAQTPDGVNQTPDDMFTADASLVGSGLNGVVTGVIGIDGVHGAYSEVHPVFAIAVNTSVTPSNSNGVQQTWAFFIRNYGNGGGCSSEMYGWPSDNNEFYIQLPWPQGATSLEDANTNILTVWPNKVKVVEGLTGQFWGTQPAKGWIHRSADPGWTLIKVKVLGSGKFFMDGQLTLEYDFPKGVFLPPLPGVWSGGPQGEVEGRDRTIPRGKRVTVAAPQTAKEKEERFKQEKHTEDSLDLNALAARIADPAVRARFTKDAQDALRPFLVKTTPKTAVPITFDTSLQVEPRTSGAASRGEGTPAEVSPDVSNEAVHKAIKKLLDTYRSQIEASSPRKE
jgi:hypothetical protein